MALVAAVASVVLAGLTPTIWAPVLPGLASVASMIASHFLPVTSGEVSYHIANHPIWKMDLHLIIRLVSISEL